MIAIIGFFIFIGALVVAISIWRKWYMSRSMYYIAAISDMERKLIWVEAELAGVRGALEKKEQELMFKKKEEEECHTRLGELQERDNQRIILQAQLIKKEEDISNMMINYHQAYVDFQTSQVERNNLHDQLMDKEKLYTQVCAQRDRWQFEQQQLSIELSSLKTKMQIVEVQHDEKLMMMSNMYNDVQKNVRKISQEIFVESSQNLQQEQKKNLSVLLDPLRDRMKEFQECVKNTYEQEARERFSLGKEVERLMTMNVRVSEEAKNLTRALKSNHQAQGAWGEFILTKLLENSGLRAGIEYTVQTSFTQENGRRLQPDVIVHFPDMRDMVVDSKLSLIAFEKYIYHSNEAEEEKAEVYLKKHIESLKVHIRSLASKNYQCLYQLKSLDFVLLFVPIEPAYLIALRIAPEIFEEAWQKNVLLVCPTTLMINLRITAYLWRQEQQKNHVGEIVKQAGSLFNKFVGFVGDMEELGKKLSAANKSYDQAYKKLRTGRGNLIRQVELLRDYGITSTKSLAKGFQQESDDSECDKSDQEEVVTVESV